MYFASSAENVVREKPRAWRTKAHNNRIMWQYASKKGSEKVLASAFLEAATQTKLKNSEVRGFEGLFSLEILAFRGPFWPFEVINRILL